MISPDGGQQLPSRRWLLYKALGASISRSASPATIGLPLLTCFHLVHRGHATGDGAHQGKALLARGESIRSALLFTGPIRGPATSTGLSGACSGSSVPGCTINLATPSGRLPTIFNWRRLLLFEGLWRRFQALLMPRRKRSSASESSFI